jgi:hypothetical protein
MSFRRRMGRERVSDLKVRSYRDCTATTKTIITHSSAPTPYSLRILMITLTGRKGSRTTPMETPTVRNTNMDLSKTTGIRATEQIQIWQQTGISRSRSDHSMILS